MFSEAVIALAADVLVRARHAGLMIATAESCTGGLLSACLTSVPGASSVLDRGYVTYSNAAKTEVLGVPASLIEVHGAVSEEVAIAMAEGALARSRAQITVSVTGIAGPGGGTEEKPVGLVWFGAARTGYETISEVHRFGDIGRPFIREKSLEVGLRLFDRLILEDR